MALTYRQITATADDGSGNPVTSGTALFTPSATLYASGVPVLTPAVPISGEFIDGQLYLQGSTAGNLVPIQLLTQDNTGLDVEGLTGFWFWTVRVTLAGVSYSWSFMIAAGDPLDLWSTQNTPAIT